MLIKPNTCHNKSHFNPNICAIPPSQGPIESAPLFSVGTPKNPPSEPCAAHHSYALCTKAELSTGQPPACNNNKYNKYGGERSGEKESKAKA